MEDYLTEENRHWKRNLTISIVIIAAIMIVGFAYEDIQGYALHVEKCNQMYENLKDSGIVESLIEIPDYQIFKNECSDLYDFE
jgi:hypothetical protein